MIEKENAPLVNPSDGESRNLKWYLLSVALSLLYSLIFGIIFFGPHGYGYALFTVSEFLLLPLIPAYFIGFLICRNTKKPAVSKVLIIYWEIYYLIAVWWISAWTCAPHPPVQILLLQDTVFFIIFLQLPYLLYASLLFYHLDMRKSLLYLLIITPVVVFLGWVLSYGWWLNWY